jgi:hypothetical protein
MYPIPYKEAGNAMSAIINMKNAASASTENEIVKKGNEVGIVATNAVLVKRIFAEKIRASTDAIIAEILLVICATSVSFCRSKDPIAPSTNKPSAVVKRLIIMFNPLNPPCQGDFILLLLP